MIAYSAQTPSLMDFSWFILVVAILAALAIWLRDK